jgi:hypothetical protein
MKIVLIIVVVLIMIYLIKSYNTNKELNIKIKCGKPKLLLLQKKEVMLNPVDVEYYNRLKDMRELLKDRRIKNYNMNKETINNEVADIPIETIETIEFERIELRIPEEINLNNFDNNAQNVHDSTVQDTIRQKFIKLKKNIIKKQININEILMYAKNKLTDKFKEDRLKFILNSIRDRNSRITNLENNTELEILGLVWDDEKIRDQIINELFDCYNGEYNNIVCPTGVVTRLLNADIVLNPETTPRTIEILRTEMLNLAAQIRTECERKEEYLNKTEEEQDMYLKEKIKTKINDTYKGILSIETIQKELDTWLDVI